MLYQYGCDTEGHVGWPEEENENGMAYTDASWGPQDASMTHPTNKERVVTVEEVSLL